MLKNIIPTIVGLAAAGLAMSFLLDTNSSDSEHTMVMLGVGLPVFLVVMALCGKFTDKKKRP